MKKQLRNLALVSALMTAGTAFAGTPVLEDQWNLNVTSTARYAAVYGGKVYFVDNVDKAIYCVDKDGNKTEVVKSDNLFGVAIAFDQAGNILAKPANPFHASTTSNHYIIFDLQDDGTYVELPDVVDFSPAAAVDQIGFEDAIPDFRYEVFGQIIGDVMSEDGAIMYVVGNAANPYTYTAFFQNGAKGDYSILNPEDGTLNAISSVSTLGGDNMTVAQPIYSNMTEAMAAIQSGVKIQDSFVQRKRGNNGLVQYINEVGEFGTLLKGNSFSTSGLAYFNLAGEAYVVIPTNPASHTNNFQVIRVSDGVVMGKTNFPNVVAGSGQCGYSIEVVDEQTVNIVSGCPGLAINFATFSTKPVVYFDNTEAGWKKVYAYCWNADGNNAAWPGVEITEKATSGNYKYSGFDEAYENIIFNNGEGAKTADLQLIQGQVYGLYYPHVYLVGNLTGASWDPANTAAELTYKGNGVYEIDNVTLVESAKDNNTAYISFITAAGSWQTAEAYDRIGAETENEAIEGQANVSIQKGSAYSWKLEAYEVDGVNKFDYIYKFTLDVVNKTLTVGKTSGVKAIEADASAPAVYYNLQGVQVENPQNGLFIVKRGNKVTKEIIR